MNKMTKTYLLALAIRGIAQLLSSPFRLACAVCAFGVKDPYPTNR